MSSGLRFIAGQDPDYTPDKGYPDHMLIYTGAIDVFKHSITRPLQFPPNTDGRYRNSDPLTIGYLIRQAVEKRGENYLTFPQRALFDRIGIRRQVLETDPYGNFVMTGYDYGTARNWARIGMLYLQDGMWNGQRLLPEGWAKFVSTPAPAWKQPVYGGLFWLNGIGTFPIPKNSYYAAGGGGQNVFIIPDKDMVVVRLGHFRGAAAATPRVDAALAKLMSGGRRFAALEISNANGEWRIEFGIPGIRNSNSPFDIRNSSFLKRSHVLHDRPRPMVDRVFLLVG